MPNPLHELAQDLRANIAFGSDSPSAHAIIHQLDIAIENDPDHLPRALAYARKLYTDSVAHDGDGEEQIARIDALIGKPVTADDIRATIIEAGLPTPTDEGLAQCMGRIGQWVDIDAAIESLQFSDTPCDCLSLYNYALTILDRRTAEAA